LRTRLATGVLCREASTQVMSLSTAATGSDVPQMEDIRLLGDADRGGLVGVAAFVCGRRETKVPSRRIEPQQPAPPERVKAGGRLARRLALWLDGTPRDPGVSRLTGV
jgi:hypothetical protein